VKSFVEPVGGQSTAPFHISAALEYRWDSLQTRENRDDGGGRA
jgi:hypothetical protein